MTERPEFYAVLAVAPDATRTEIAHAYRTLLRRYHPDTRTPADQTQHARCDTALQQVLAAYTVLGDPARRANYDRQVAARARPAARQQQPHAPTSSPTHLQQPIVAGPVRWHRGPYPQPR